MSALCIERLRLAHFGAVGEDVDLGTFDRGVTVIVGPNETGKSTVVEALRCALFERHRTKHQGIRGLVPHNGEGDPEVWLTISLGTDRYHIHKRFMKGALSELRLERAGLPDRLWTGDDADAELWHILGAEPPSSRGRAASTDLGAWGLLWVRQDDAATREPGDGAAASARKTIAEAVGRQVNQALGGDGSERLIERIAEVHGRYFTGKTQQATGPLAAAEKEVVGLEADVRSLTEALRQTEALAEQRKDLEARRAANRRSLDAAQRALRQAESRAEQAQAAGRRVHEARLEAERARARFETARRQLELRTEQQTELEAAAQRATESEAVLTSLSESIAASSARTRRAADLHAEAQRAHAGAQVELGRARARLTRAQLRSTQARRRADLAQARRLHAEIQALAAEVAGAPDDAVLQRVEQGDLRRQNAQARLEREATQLVIGHGTPTASRWLVGRERSIHIPEMGTVTLSPAAPGLAEARLLQASEAQRLADRLATVGLASVEDARAAHAVRAELQTAATDAEHLRNQWAPEGLPALTDACAALKEQHRTVAGTLAEAQSLRQRLAEADEALARAAVDEAALAELETLGRALNTSQARRDAAATRVELTALEALTVEHSEASDDGETGAPSKPLALKAGSSHAFEITRPTTLNLGHTARVVVSPGGLDGERAERELSTSAAALDRALQLRGLPDLKTARDQAGQQRALSAEASVLRANLTALAPAGVDALSHQAATLFKGLTDLTARLARAQEAAQRLEAAQAALGRNPMDSDAWQRIEAAHQAEIAAREDCAARGARLRWPDGTVVAATAPTDGTRTVDGAPWAWQLNPGLGGAEAELDLAEALRSLRLALAFATNRPLQTEIDEPILTPVLTDVSSPSADETDWEAEVARVRQSWQLGLSARARLGALSQALATVAPAGLGALEAAAIPSADDATAETDFKDETAKDGLTAADPAALEAEARSLLAQAEIQFDTHSVALELAVRALAEARETQAAHTETLAARRATAVAARAEHDRMASRLLAERQATADDALSAGLANAQAAANEAEQQLSSAQRQHADVGGDDASAEVQSQQAVVVAVGASDTQLRIQLADVEARIRASAAEGLFEQLAEAESDLARAQETRTRMRRDAAAAQRLNEVARRHHEETQARFLAPVIKEVAPYLQKLRPGSLLQMQPDLRVAHVIRNGAEEAFDQLSGGTREQLAVIVRVALAQVLARDGRALPLILDDIMGWTDDGRFDRMMSILKKASDGLQIIVLTCHPERFLRLGARRTIDLEALRFAARTPAGSAHQSKTERTPIGDGDHP